jgi:hypothetical protein
MTEYTQLALESAKIPEDQRQLARAAFEQAVKAGFLHCTAIFNENQFDGLWVRGDATDRALSWGRVDPEFLKRFRFVGGQLVQAADYVPPPPELAWEAYGLECEVRLNNIGFYCGYVAVRPNHPWHGLGYDQCRLGSGCKLDHSGFCTPESRVEVHGGLTYAGPRANSTSWVFGFDCAHAGDAPVHGSKFATLGFGNPTDHQWTLEEVKHETERLAEQLAQLIA